MLTTVLVTAILGVGLLAINSVVTPQRAWRRWATCLLMLSVLGVNAYLWVDLTGRPRPHGLEWRAGRTEVIAEHWREGEGVWIWVLWPDDPVPRAYAMPWSEEVAESLREARRDEEEEGRMPVAEFRERRADADEAGEEPVASTFGQFLDSIEDRDAPLVYAMPQTANPPKPAPRQRPEHDFGSAQAAEQ